MVRGWVSLNVFQAWLYGTSSPPIYIDGDYDIVPCLYGDMNCHGWRLVARKESES